MKRFLLWFNLLVFVLFLAVVMKSSQVFISIFNLINVKYQEVNEQVSNLNSEYEKRYALVDNLVSIIKETKEFEQYQIEIEKQIYEKVAQAKAEATKLNLQIPETIQKRIQKENDLSNILVNFIDKIAVMAQHYPQISDPTIKEHNQTFASLDKLRNDIKDLEENIIYARRTLNQYVKFYNSSITAFPANFVAKWNGFKTLSYFEVINGQAKETPKLKF